MRCSRRRAAEMPQRVLQALRQRREALAAEHHPGMGEARPGETEVIEHVVQRLDGARVANLQPCGKPDQPLDRVRAINRMRGLTGLEKCVAIAIAVYDGPGGAHPTFAALAKDTARPRGSVTQAVRSLCDKGISTGDFAEALAALLGPDAGGLSASTVARLTEVWADQHAHWLKRDLSATLVPGAVGGDRLKELIARARSGS